MLKLYHAPRTRSARVRWMLEEMEVPYELVLLDRTANDHKKPAYLKIHPHGLIPALVDGDTVLFESAAICMYLAEKCPEKKLAPLPGTKERGLYYQWLAYSMTMLEPPAANYFYHTFRYPAQRRDPREEAESKEKVMECLAVLNRELEGKDFIVGGHFTAADVVLCSLLNWASAQKLSGDFPALNRYISNLKERPAWKRATKD